MKKNNKGFSLMETLIVSAFVVTSLLYLYRQITTVKASYDISFRYNTVTGLYGADTISEYLKEKGYTIMIDGLSSSSVYYYDITNNTNIDSGSNDYYVDLLSKLNVNKVIFTKEDLTELETYLDGTPIEADGDYFTDELRNFMDMINSDGSSLYRIIVVYNDDTYATIQFS